MSAAAWRALRHQTNPHAACSELTFAPLPPPPPQPPPPSKGSSTLPGFRVLFGSIARLSVRIRASSAGLRV